MEDVMIPDDVIEAMEMVETMSFDGSGIVGRAAVLAVLAAAEAKGWRLMSKEQIDAIVDEALSLQSESFQTGER